MASNKRTYLLVFGFQDLQCVANCDDPANAKTFEQPIWQTANMFLGESLCLIVYYIQVWNESRRKQQAVYQPILDEGPVANGGEHDDEELPQSASDPLLAVVQQRLPLTGHRNFYMWLPTLCDLCATTLMNAGLIYVAASVYQMLRGSVVLFTGTLSSVYLRRHHPIYRWFALCAVFAGVALVGSASIVQGQAPTAPSLGDDNKTMYNTLSNHYNTYLIANPNAPIGVTMIIVAQVFTAAQFVIEELLMSRYDLPAMKAVGLEGVFGLLSLVILVPITYFGYGRNDPGGFFDVVVGWNQMVGHPNVLGAGIAICFSIASFNWFGLSVTRSVSATARSTIDTTLFIWVISLSLGWENFKSLQVVGFAVLLYGTLLFNDVVRPPPLAMCRKAILDEQEVVVAEQDDERAIASAT
ncbi:hypothetical protein SmJEL517_g03482 [Synchytrium microbalum]|uniref:EamA domain-containing protein n=1 Tax=Synchytrium microbalum TaxID=1806994 RepID=A0A507C881_9FUNG|nr:uncharacterized protein SmJEL517_g03482 [Synchytrium microbalum]TPX33733.1 hypothetical protein SmJEL517_g03482 [Synchytrium microbalum]